MTNPTETKGKGPALSFRGHNIPYTHDEGEGKVYLDLSGLPPDVLQELEAILDVLPGGWQRVTFH